MTRQPEPKQAALDDAFTRSLLESARGDDPPPGHMKDAWLRFSEAVGATSALVAAGGGAGAALTPGRGGAATAAKWLIIGAVGGGGAAAMWMHARGAEPSADRAALPALTSSGMEGPVMAAATSAQKPVESIDAPPSAVDVERAGLPHAMARGVEREPSPAGPERVQAEKSRRARIAAGARSSTLAEQVVLLDSARTAIAIGATEDALRLVEQYHRRFPTGELRAEADVVRIEALIDKGDYARAARDAERFLARHPDDPHAPRVRVAKDTAMRSAADRGEP